MLLWCGWLLHESTQRLAILDHRCGTTVVVPEHAQGPAHTCETLCQLRLGYLEVCTGFPADRIHLSLLIGQSCKLCLQLLHFTLASSRLRSRLVDLRSQLRNVTFQF